MIIIKPLTQSGNSKAIVLDRSILQAAGLGADALFAITVNPDGGVTIQSVKPTHVDIKHAAFQKMLKENKDLLKRLSDR
ncbi:MAG TPA: hypothetical protein VLH77_06240 [Gammaproteobacteria bacterium]|nr:hypothetical protein [Gammaproteobacteria bacterium]